MLNGSHLRASTKVMLQLFVDGRWQAGMLQRRNPTTQ